MARAISPIGEFEYVLMAERELPEDQQTVFKCRTLSGIERLKARAAIGRGASLSGDVGDKWEPDFEGWLLVAAEALPRGLIGWERFLDVKGKPIEWPGTLQAVGMINPSDAGEIGQEIWVRSNIDADQKKA